MPGDYTRWTFDPVKDYAGVLKQQGRVALDADWNEQVHLLDRRWRAETIDIIGRCVVPRETPDGFRIQVSNDTFTIGPGRIYVDGLLAENHGKAPLSELDTTLGELRSRESVPYTEQPYLPEPPPLPEGGPHLVYLDVWQREVTYIQDRDLLEKALGGADTATRLQTVWQVKALSLEGLERAECGAAIPAWDALVAPSAGRLSTSAVAPPASDDPCIISPGGGYRGLENRLYRVQIHTPGGPGTATFKWSRANGSDVAAVEALDTDGGQSRLTVSRIGRDPVRRFQVGDIVEVLDDHLELGGQSGPLARVVAIDDAQRVLTVAPALAAGAFDVADARRHTRVLRWDQKDDVGPDEPKGLLVPPGSESVKLEDGIEVAFSVEPADGAFKAGDYWVFAARTADGSVEPLDQAPPRGVLHHYCRLAVVTFPDTATDCRVLWPPEQPEAGCDCTVCVSAESHNDGTLTIQRAIDQVKDRGGKICLGPGVFHLRDLPLRVAAARSVRISGHGRAAPLDAGTTLVFHGIRDDQAPAALIIERSFNIMVEELSIVAAVTSPEGGQAVVVRDAGDVTIERCAFSQHAAAEGIEAGSAIMLEGSLVGTVVRDNEVTAAVGIGTRRARAVLGDRIVPLPTLALANLRVEDNLLACERRGLDLEGFVVGVGAVRLSGNTVHGGSQGGMVVVGAVNPGSPVTIEGNAIRATGDGVVVGTDEARVCGNDIGVLEPGRGGNGIVLAAGLDRIGIDRCLVLGNRVSGVPGHGVSIRGQVRSGMIKQNVVEGVFGAGLIVEVGGRAEMLSVENNHFLDIAPQANELGASVAAIRLLQVAQADVASNTIRGVGQAARQGPGVAGIQLVACSSARVAGNDVSDVGPPDRFAGAAAAIDVLAPFDRLDVLDNAARRYRQRAEDPDTSSEWYALRIRRPTTGFVGIADTVAFALLEEATIGFFGNRAVALPRGREIAAVRGNRLEASGRRPAVEIATSGALVFTDNRCLLTAAGEPEDLPPTAVVGASTMIMSGNYAEGPQGIRLQVAPTRVTVVGNVTGGAILVNGQSLVAPWDALNVVAP